MKTRSLAIKRACSLIERDISARHRIASLARECGMSPYHFQRQFALSTGETVAGYVRSRRLEKAAIKLSETSARIIDVALDCGFETHAALTRAFSEHFGCSPSVFRQSGLPETSRGLPPRPYLKPISSRALSVTFDLVAMPEQWLGWQQTKGVSDGLYFADLDAVGSAFKALGAEIKGREAAFGTAFPQGPAGYEDPSAVGYFGAFVEERFELSWPEGWTCIPAGTYAVFPHFGPMTAVHLSWHRAARVGLDDAGLRFRNDWMFEIYLTPEPRTRGDALTALIHLPVESSTIGKAQLPD